MNNQSKSNPIQLNDLFNLETFRTYLPMGVSWQEFCLAIGRNPWGWQHELVRNYHTYEGVINVVRQLQERWAVYIECRITNKFCQDWFQEQLVQEDRNITEATRKALTPLNRGLDFMTKVCPTKDRVLAGLRIYNNQPSEETQRRLFQTFEQENVDMTVFMHHFRINCLGEPQETVHLLKHENSIFPKTGEEYLKCAMKSATSTIPGFMTAVQDTLGKLLQTTDLGDLTQNPQMKEKTIADLFDVDTRFAWIIPSLMLLHELRNRGTLETSIFEPSQNVHAELKQAMDAVLTALPLSKAMFPFGSSEIPESPGTLLSLLNHLEILDEEIREIFGNQEELTMLDPNALFLLIDVPEAKFAVKKCILELIVKRAAEKKVETHMFLDYTLCERPATTRTPKKFVVPEYQAKEGEWKVVFKTVGINDDEVMARLEEEEVHPNQLPNLTGDEIALLLKGLKLGPRNRLIAQCRLLNGMH